MVGPGRSRANTEFYVRMGYLLVLLIPDLVAFLIFQVLLSLQLALPHADHGVVASKDPKLRSAEAAPDSDDHQASSAAPAAARQPAGRFATVADNGFNTRGCRSRGAVRCSCATVPPMPRRCGRACGAGR